MRVVIADDEPLALALMRAMLDRVGGVDVVAECPNGEAAVKAVHQHHPDLLFLDIEMPGLSGFDVVKALQADIMPMVVFATAYEQYALKAFDLHAVDYVMKPLDSGRVARAIARAAERLAARRDLHELKPALIGVIDELAGNRISPGMSTAEPPPGRSIAIKDSDGIYVVPSDDIDWIDAAGDYMCIHTGGRTLVMRSTMKDLLEKLDDARFQRVHRSTIVNTSRIQQVVPLPKGDYTLHLDCGEQIRVSRNYRAAVKSFLDAIR